MQQQTNTQNDGGLQHLLAMYSGSILVPMMIGSSRDDITAEQLTYLVSSRYFHVRIAALQL